MKKEKDTLQRELQRKVNPTSKLDFALLFNELETWRKQEVTRIKVCTIFILYFICINIFRFVLSIGNDSKGGGEEGRHVGATGQ